MEEIHPHLKEDERNIGDKKRDGKLVKQEKNILIPNMIVLWGYGIMRYCIAADVQITSCAREPIQ